MFSLASSCRVCAQGLCLAREERSARGPFMHAGLKESLTNR